MEPLSDEVSIKERAFAPLPQLGVFAFGTRCFFYKKRLSQAKRMIG
jgi:hypothetical protein